MHILNVSLPDTHILTVKKYLAKTIGPGVILTLILANSCTAPQTPDTKLYGKAMHSGSAVLYRVDDSWHPDKNKRQLYKVGDGIDKRTPPFLPIRHKADIAGLDGPERIVTNEDIVTVTLKTVFIKYFKEFGGRERKGEIALVMSFEAGAVARESILIYSSEGQTLGSYLDLDDMPIIGPIRFGGDDIMVRIVMIEMDQIENETQKQFIRAIANTSSTFAPEIGTVLSIAQPVAEFIINQNADDVILDHRFSLQRVFRGQFASRNALLYGKYVILLQEDRLTGTDVTKMAPHAILPPAPDRMRFGGHTDRLFRVYNYMPVLPLNQTKADQCPEPSIDLATLCGTLYESEGPIYYDRYFIPEKHEGCTELSQLNLNNRKCLRQKWVNSDGAIEIRQTKLGYQRKILTDLDLFVNFYHASEAAAKEGYRGKPVSSTGDDKAKKKEEQINLDFPIIQYPKSFTLLTPYPLHTYLVFSVERSLGGEGRTADERFQKFSDFIEYELGSVRESDQMGELAQKLHDALLTRKKHGLEFKKIAALPKDKTSQKICRLWALLSNPRGVPEKKKEENILADRAIYNEMFHIAGNIWNHSSEVMNYLKDNDCPVYENSLSCSCLSE
jgi:hypothetical protein